MTNDYCASICTSQTAQATRHFGTQHGSECHCGTVSNVSKLGRAPDWMCNYQCAGREGKHEDCGGNWVLSLWERVG
jgi:hypothetical protein